MLSPTSRVVRSFAAFGLLPFILSLLVFAGGRALAADEYTIQPDDTLNIKVTGEDKLSRDYPVDEKGDVMLDLVGKVHLAGKTVPEAEKALDAALKKYIKVFTVNVLVVNEIGSRAMVYGEIARTGPVKVRAGTKLLDVLAEAGQPTANADTKRISIARKGGKSPEIVDLDAILSDATKDVDIRAGDRITIPSKVSQSVEVLGAVANPGSKPLETARTAYAAIQAAGPKENADYSKVILTRRGTNLPLTVDLSRVRAGDFKADLDLQEGDRLQVPSRFSGVATVSGEAKTPGEKELNGPVQLPDFLNTLGGGLTDRADRRHVQITREGKEIVVDLVAIENGDRRSDDPELEVRAGDKIYISTATAQIGGAVRSAGTKVIGDSPNIWDFINTAGGGLSDRADKTNVKVYRNGKLIKTVDLSLIEAAVISLDDPSLQVQPGDRIFVPDNSRTAFRIVGGVRKGGIYPCVPGTTLLDAINMADGFAESFDYKRIIIAPARLFDQTGKFVLPAGEEPPDAPADGKPKAAADGQAPDGKPKDEKDDKTNPKRKTRPRPDGRRKADVDKDPEKYGLIVVDYKKLAKGDLTQIPVINPGDRILVPVKAHGNRDGSNNGPGGILGFLTRTLFFSPF